MGDYRKTVRTADHFIEKFSAISEERWAFANGTALDFCDPGVQFQGKMGHWWPGPGSEQQELATLFWFGLKYEDVSAVEAGKVKRFQGTTPKERILEALNEIKAKGA